MVFLSACSNKNTDNTIPETSYNPFENHETAAENEQADAMFGYGLVESAVDQKIKYDENLSIDFWINNSGDDSNVGFMIFVDGVRQDYSINGEDEKTGMHIFEVKSGEKITFTANFEPTAEKYSDTLNFSYGIINNPKFTPDSPTTVFGNNYRIEQISFIAMADVSERIKTADNAIEVQSVEITNEEKQEFIEYDESGNVCGNQLDGRTQLRSLKNGSPTQDGDPAPNSVSPSDTLELQLLGGKKQLWRVSMYVDHKLVPAFNGAYYADMTSDADTKSVYTINMSEIDLPDKEYGAIYFIAVPVENGMTSVIMSPIRVYSREDK